ncbi:unnamed protein product [Moneuplotes crassus]|uniref:Uncharacterized protein n=1 Tax=Euplotes crassus TaxID=5936 RepID=A0AAD1UC49_EUPCR|nr:unnamed protein product [Moneuplotes crassus]
MEFNSETILGSLISYSERDYEDVQKILEEFKCEIQSLISHQKKALKNEDQEKISLVCKEAEIIRLKMEQYAEDSQLFLNYFRSKIRNTMIKDNGGASVENLQWDTKPTSSYIDMDMSKIDIEKLSNSPELIVKEIKGLMSKIKVQDKAFNIKLEQNEHQLNDLKDEVELYKSQFTEEELKSFQKKQSEVLQRRLTISNEVKDPNRIELNEEEFRSFIKEKMKGRPKGSTYFMDGVFAIDLNSNWTRDLVRDLGRKYYLPECIKKIYIYYLGKGNTFIKMLLGSSIWHKIDTLGINDYAKHKYKKGKGLDISEYVPCLANVARRIEKNLWLFYFSVSTEDLNEIMRSVSHINDGLSFRYGNLNLNDFLDFGFEEYKIRYLSLRNCNINESSYSFGLLCNAISESGLKDSLKEIRIHGSSFGNEDPSSTLKNYKLSHITLNKKKELKSKS